MIPTEAEHASSCPALRSMGVEGCDCSHDVTLRLAFPRDPNGPSWRALCRTCGAVSPRRLHHETAVEWKQNHQQEHPQ